MTREPDTVPADAGRASAALAFAVAGVVPDGDASPRLRHRRAGGGYDQAGVVPGRVVAVGDGVELCFQLPPGGVDFILVEPAAVPGRYRIPRLAYAGVVVADLASRVIAADGGVDVDVHANPAAVQFGDGRGRPVLEIDVRGLGGDEDGGRRVDLLLLRDADGVSAADAFSQLLGRMSADREVDRAGMARLARELGSASGGLRALSDAVSGLPAMAAAQERLIERVDGLAAGIGNCASDQHSLAALVASGETAAAERAASSAAAAAAAQAGRDAMARDIEHVRHTLADLQSQVARVTNSVENVFWRRWLRRLRGGTR